MTKAGKIFFAIVIACACATAQQTTGSIRGSISDPSGAVVQNANVTARNTETGFGRSATSDNGGNFLLLELPVGHYQLEVSATGFSKYLQAGITLNVNETANVPVKLTVGSQGEKVQVEADAQLIQPTVTSLGQVVTEKDILDLPLDGRDFSTLGLLQPGVVPLTPGLKEASGGDAGLRAREPYSVNGQRPESNNFLIDGANNFNGVDGGFVLTPPIDAIEEFRIITHNSNAEFGDTLGSTTNIITRSGTNNFHGALWEFLRNDMFDSTQYPATSKQYLKRNQFGGSIGGPIQHEKTFFFGFYEGYRNHQGQTQQTTVPSLAERGGDFGQLCTAGFITSGPLAGFCSDPNQQLFNVFLNQPYPFNQMPAPNPSDPSSMSQFSLNLLSLFPAPDPGSPNIFTSTQPVRNTTNDFGIRIDHYLTSADNLNFRYMFSQSSNFDPFPPGGASVPGFPVTTDQRSQNFVAQETHTFSPSMVGVVRLSYLRNKFLFGQHTNNTTPASLGFQYQPSLAAAVGAPFIQVNGYTDVGNPITGPRNTYENAYDASGSISWIHGAHELKFGGGYQHMGINVLQGIATNGFFVFVPFPVTDAFASFLWAHPVVFLQGRGSFSRDIRGWALNGYGQDTYKLNRRVTLNYGLRYELPTPYTEIHNRQTLWIPGRQSTVMPSAPAGLLYPGDKGVPAGLVQTDKKAFAPRFGVAIDPTGTGNWLVTSAYGMYYEPYYTGQGGPLQAPISAPPYLQTPQVPLSFFYNFADPFNGNPPAPGQFTPDLTNLTLSPNLTLPYSQDWDLNVQHSFGQDLLFEIGYVGTKGTHLPRFIEGNPTKYIPGIDPSTNQPYSTSGNADQRRLYSGCTLADPQSSCVYSSTGLISSIANSSYNALETSLRKRFSHGVSFLASYTLSKSIDDASSFNMTGSAAKPVAGENDLAQNPFDLAAERGRSLFDARHRFVFSYEWSLPFFKDAHGFARNAFAGWQLNGIATVMSGTPFTVFDSHDVSVQGSAPEITGFSANRPNLVSGQDPNAGPHTANAWLNKNAFVAIQQDPNSPVQQFGNAGRNIAQGPGYANWDFSAFKNFRVTEGKELQFRAELFNFLNHTNLRLPDSDISSPTFNHIFESQPPRLVQFALKFLF